LTHKFNKGLCNSTLIVLTVVWKCIVICGSQIPYAVRLINCNRLFNIDSNSSLHLWEKSIYTCTTNSSLYLMAFGGRNFQQTVSILLVLPMLLFSSTCSLIRTRQTSYRGFSRKTKRSSPYHFISRSSIQMMSFY
jgi:hypothetical protein